MPLLVRLSSAVFTAMAICIGSCWGTTDVMMITLLSSNWCVVRSPFSIPFFSTYPAATWAHHMGGREGGDWC